jgi:hypothetical protein
VLSVLVFPHELITMLIVDDSRHQRAVAPLVSSSCSRAATCSTIQLRIGSSLMKRRICGTALSALRLAARKGRPT